jgi:hypothetical protein
VATVCAQRCNACNAGRSDQASPSELVGIEVNVHTGINAEPDREADTNAKVCLQDLALMHSTLHAALDIDTAGIPTKIDASSWPGSWWRCV